MDLIESSFSDCPSDLNRSIDLVRRHQAGEPGALEQLLERYQERLLRIVRVRLGGRLREQLESMDIVQGANLVAMRKLSELEVLDESSILRWLSQIALNQIRDAHHYFQADRRDAGRVVPLDPGPDDDRGAYALADEGVPEPVEAASVKELRELVDQCVSELSDEHRELIVRRDYELQDWAEIAVALGDVEKQSAAYSPEERLRRAVHAAQERHSRAWTKVRKSLRKRMGGDIAE